jgi:hypothetical protein
MLFFILFSLAVLLAAFLIMISVQIIGLEKNLKSVIELTEFKVRKLYGKD